MSVAAGGGGGGDEAPTVTVVVAAVEPPLLVAVSVYIVVCVGLTVIEVPLTALPFTLRDVAPVADQESALDCPATMLPGVAPKLTITGGAEGGGGVPEVGTSATALTTGFPTEP
jgi:hypothetical protein